MGQTESKRGAGSLEGYLFDKMRCGASWRVTEMRSKFGGVKPIGEVVRVHEVLEVGAFEHFGRLLVSVRVRTPVVLDGGGGALRSGAAHPEKALRAHLVV